MPPFKVIKVVENMSREKTNLISYFTIIGFLIAFIKGDRKNCRFHLNQGLVLGLYEFVFILIDAAGRAFGNFAVSVFCLALIIAAACLLFLDLWVGIKSAVSDTEAEMPLLGRINIINKTPFSGFRMSSCHNHTTYSDGSSTPYAMVAEAVKLGLTGIGITDHSYTDFDQRYCIKKEKTPDYISEIKRLQTQFAGRLAVAVGLELDLYSRPIKREDYDFVIGSVHYIKHKNEYYPIDDSKNGEERIINEVFGGDITEFASAYYNSVLQNVIKNRPDIIGHFDLITKFGLINESESGYRNIVFETIDKILETDPEIIFEVNTGVIWRGYKKSAYPNDFILKYLCDKNARVTVNADAHSASKIAFGFENELMRLYKKGFKKITILTRKGFVDVDLKPIAK